MSAPPSADITGHVRGRPTRSSAKLKSSGGTMLRESSSTARYLQSLRSRAAEITELTDRQREVLDLVSVGRSNEEIATALFITSRTVKSHVALLMERLEVDSRLKLAQIALLWQLQDCPQGQFPTRSW
jgi:NarL family two-component system response regulator LiaR